MLYAAKAANLAFICNVVIDADKKVIAALPATAKKLIMPVSTSK